jgi:demethylmenaquinone methyltransferase/2-methoxy-6-polyprenyl-1,4-benzoquinol methylase
MIERDYPDSRRVQEMFAGIAHRYDFLNHFLSASIDRRWRRIAVNKVRELMETAPAQPAICLDLCSGTGDLALALHRGLHCDVVASDFCHPMLTRANDKVRGLAVRNVEADALNLPFADNSFNALTIAFGLRNLEDPGRGLNEMRRVLKPGGAAVILEFSKPVVPVLKHVFNFYFRHILPKLGAIISGDAEAYQYLPDSVRKFPAQEELAEFMKRAGFRDVGYRNLSGGIAALHWGRLTGSERPRQP